MTAIASRSRAFFLELLLCLAIFAICAAIALQVFAEAHLVSERSSALSHLNIEVQSAAEKFKLFGDSQSFNEAIGTSRDDNNMLTCYYTSDYVRTTDTDAPYVIQISFSTDDQFAALSSEVKSDALANGASEDTNLVPGVATVQIASIILLYGDVMLTAADVAYYDALSYASDSVYTGSYAGGNVYTGSYAGDSVYTSSDDTTNYLVSNYLVGGGEQRHYVAASDNAIVATGGF
ncbi:MAG: hypothetical protein LBG97_08045 [Coriobacteriales bacterium]|jgi:Tfp pilus assembly protein PilE|nr:hypothetical protein [Coriobacteriales bacterium]